MNQYLLLLIAIVSGCMLAACERPAAGNDAAELRAEIEQLENQLGRLEFRVYELEQTVGGNLPQQRDAALPEDSNPVRKPPSDAGRYDLTPVE